MVDPVSLAIIAIVISVFSVVIAVIETYITKTTVDLQRKDLVVHKQEVEDATKRFSAEQEQRKNEERQRNIREHIDRLIHRLDLLANPTKTDSPLYYSTAQYSKLGWARRALRTSIDKKEWLEHLLTGHDAIYNLFATSEQLEKDNLEAYNAIRTEVEKEIGEVAGRLGLTKDFPKEYPSCDKLNITGQVMNKLTGLTKVEFGVVSPPLSPVASADSIYNIMIDNTTFAYCGQDKTMAEGFASAINSIGAPSGGMGDDVTKYLKQVSKLQENDSELDKQVNSFIHGKELEGGGLGGACELCLKWQDEKDRAKLKILFAKVAGYLAGM